MHRSDRGEKAHPPVSAEPSAEPVRVLIVDDNRSFSDLLSAALDSVPGITCVGTASSAAEGFARVVELTPSVVVMDLMMPGLDGLGCHPRAATDQPGDRCGRGERTPGRRLGGPRRGGRRLRLHPEGRLPHGDDRGAPGDPTRLDGLGAVTAASPCAPPGRVRARARAGVEAARRGCAHRPAPAVPATTLAAGCRELRAASQLHERPVGGPGWGAGPPTSPSRNPVSLPCRTRPPKPVNCGRRMASRTVVDETELGLRGGSSRCSLFLAMAQRVRQ